MGLIEEKNRGRKSRITVPLKGASHEIEMGRTWYQKKDLGKIEVRG